MFAPLRYLLNSVPDLAATGEEVATHYAAQPGWAQTALVLHAGAGGLALLLSPVQLSARVRARVPRVHRVVGRAALAAIAVAGAAGLVLASVSLAGAIGTAGFGALALTWLTCAALGFRSILHGDVAAHRRWMIRTFALTYAGVTLRLWLIETVQCTALPQEVLARPAIARRVAAVGDEPLPPWPGPDRAQLLRLLAA